MVLCAVTLLGASKDAPQLITGLFFVVIAVLIPVFGILIELTGNGKKRSVVVLALYFIGCIMSLLLNSVWH
jgi:MFS family permease